MSGRLVVCATPIGNLEDVTLRLLETLRTADVVACEDTRHTAGLLKRHGITAKLVSYHEHNEAHRAPELVARISAGETVALVTDAGIEVFKDSLDNWVSTRPVWNQHTYHITNVIGMA